MPYTCSFPPDVHVLLCNLEIMLLERVQRCATKYILHGSHLDYKSQLTQLRILPLTMTLELYDIAFF